MNQIVIDITPRWYQRRPFQWLRHRFGMCEGAGMVCGFECPYCFDEVCAILRRIREHKQGAA